MCAHRELHHSFFIYYGHGTLENCVIHTNPPANVLKWCMAWLANRGIKVSSRTKGEVHDDTVPRTGSWEKCGAAEDPTVMVSRQSEGETDGAVARGENLSLTAALSSVSKQASLMSLCPVLAAKRHGYTTLIAAKTGTGRNKHRE